MGNLYIVATPIGNLEDITLRAVRTLKEVDLILCEDTRQTRKLLIKFDIKNKMESFHAHSDGKIEKIADWLREGKNIALVSDAGTPGISDPGVALISELKKQIGPNLKVIPVPGASALVAALSASGMPTDGFLFLGFLPHKKGRQSAYQEILSSEKTVVFYESPHRISKTLSGLAGLEPARKAAVARELTKIYEEIRTGNLRELSEHYGKPGKARGEFTVIISRQQKK